MQRSQLRVLLERAHRGLHPAEGVFARLAGLPFVQLGELGGGGAYGGRGRRQAGRPLGGRGSGPPRARRARPCNGVVTLGRIRDGQAADRVASTRIEDGQFHGGHGHVCTRSEAVDTAESSAVHRFDHSPGR